MRRAAILLLVAAAGCKTAPEQGSVSGSLSFRPAPANPGASARAMMDVCWPPEAIGAEARPRVQLTFVQEGGRLADVMFQTQGGASNSVGRCMREVAWSYPWKPGEAPSSLEVAPPSARPSGWTVLAYVRQLSAMTYAEGSGVLDPAPLVRACLSHGLGARPNLLYRVETSPVRVFTRADGASPAVSDSERCVVAVLAATRYPGSRGFELELSDLDKAPPAAPLSEVAPYFAPADVPAGQPLDPAVAREVLQLRGPQVSACWESALLRRAGFSGGRSLRLRVGPSGEVAFAHVVGNQSNAPEDAADLLLDRCLVAAVSGARFPAAGANADVIYSWVFAHR